MPLDRSFSPVIRTAILRRLAALLAIAGTAAGALYAATLNKPDEPQSPATTAATPPPLATPPSLWKPDPKVPAEATRLVQKMEAVYRCGHSLLQNTPAGQRILFPSATGELPSLDEIGKALTGLPDLCYPSAALPRLANPRTPHALMQVLFDDLSRRPEPIRLPTLLMLAGTDSHPFAAAAHDELQAVIGQDFGSDWPRWETAISEHLVRGAHGIRNANCRFH